MHSISISRKQCGFGWFLCITFVVVSIYFLNEFTLLNKNQPLRGNGNTTTENDTENDTPNDTANDTPNDTANNIYYSKNFEYFTIDLEENTLTWCDDRHSGLGNRLGTYWVDRSIAFWLNLTFYINETCACKARNLPNGGRHFCRFTDEGHNSFSWTQFLPNSFTYTIAYLLNNNTIYNDISINTDNDRNKCILYSIYVYNYYSFRTNVLPKNRNLPNWTDAMYKPNYASFFFLNQLFIQIIQYETQNAFNSYYAKRYQQKSILNEYNFIQSMNPRNSLVIHWRCGDVLASTHGAYGFNPLSYYRNALKIWGIKNKTIENVYILAHIANKIAHRFQDGRYIYGCSELFKKINDSLKSIFIDYYTNKYMIISSGSINIDQHLLANSKFSLCGFSTFCWMGIFANKYNSMIPGPDQKPNWWPKRLQTIQSGHKVYAAATRNYHLNLSFLTNVAQSIINH